MIGVVRLRGDEVGWVLGGLSRSWLVERTMYVRRKSGVLPEVAVGSEVR